MNAVFSVGGMVHFGRVVSEALGWPLFVDCPVGSVECVYIVGLYDPPSYGHTLRMTAGAKRRIIHWCGSDVMMLQHPELLPEATHLCESENLAKELLAHGIGAPVVPFPVRSFDVTPFPTTKTVGVYFGTNPVFYGSELVIALSEALPEYEFGTYQFGQIPPDKMGGVIAKCRAYLRLTPHDGACASACEYMSAGRRAVITSDLPYAKQVNMGDFTAIVRALRYAMEQTEPDWEASAFWHAHNALERYLSDLAEQGVTP